MLGKRRNGFPLYAQFGWGLGVWMGLAGSVLLLMGHRWAVPAFALSLLGAVVGLILLPAIALAITKKTKDEKDAA